MSVLKRLTGLCAIAALVAALAPFGRADEVLKGKICYARKEGDGFQLHVMDPDGKNDKLVPNQPDKVNLMPAWSPDGKTIAFMSGPSDNGMDFGLYLINPDGTGLKRLAQNEKMAGLPAWSPDGKTIIYVADRENKPVLMSCRADGSDARELPTGLKFAIAPGFSPDGKQIIFTGTDQENDERAVNLYLSNADGSGLQKLVDIKGIAVAGSGAWSPDGKTIAYALFEQQEMKVQLRAWKVADKVDASLMDLKVPAGGLKGLASIILPSWSPDGKWLVINQPGEGESSGLWRVSADGKMSQQITPADAICFCAAWSRN